jgi:hypothetical protein
VVVLYLEGLGVGLTNPSAQKISLLQNVTKGLGPPDSLDKRPKLKKMGMKFGTWNVRSLYRAVHSGVWQKKYQNISQIL